MLQDGLLNLVVEPAIVKTPYPNYSFVTFDRGTPKFAQNKAFKNGLTHIIGEIGIQTIISGYRNVLSQIDVNDFFYFKPWQKPDLPNRCNNEACKKIPK